MNFKKVILVTLMLLAILTIGAVSASDDVASDDMMAEADGTDDAMAVDEVDTNEVEIAAENDDAAAELSYEPDFEQISSTPQETEELMADGSSSEILNNASSVDAKFSLDGRAFIEYDGKLNISLALPENATGHVYVYKLFNDLGVCSNKTIAQLYSDKGVFFYQFESSVIGRQTYFFEYVGDDYTVKNSTVDLDISPKIIVGPDRIPKSINVSVGANSGLLVILVHKWYPNPEEAMEDKWSCPSPFYNATVTGDVSIPLPEFNAGFYEIYFNYTSGDYNDPRHYCEFSVGGLPVITPKATSLVCSFESYSVSVVNQFGYPAVSKEVVFKVNGKKIATVKTDSKGVATVKLNYAPKTYTVTAEALGVSLTKKVTVKHALTLKTVTVKKSAKKLVLTATLKNGKKLISGKKITFKFNGKKYTAKTNKKGVAKVTVSKKILKKLRVGKKVTYQATYLKDTVKKTAKVKK